MGSGFEALAMMALYTKLYYFPPWVQAIRGAEGGKKLKGKILLLKIRQGDIIRYDLFYRKYFMQLIVQKFGGTSVGSISRIKNVAKIISKEIALGNQVIVVASAMAGVTNQLISQCAAISKLDSAAALKEYDIAIATGESISCALIALELQNLGIAAQSMQGWQVPIITNNNYGNAQILEIDSGKLNALLEQNIVPVITGFQGISQEAKITTLGKGGSDTSAAVIAAAMRADRCDIYTDVDGLYSADPRLIGQARRIISVSLKQLYQLCAHGAKVLHHRAALAALRYDFTLRILSSFDHIPVGTTAIKEANHMEHREINAITSNKNLLHVNIRGITNHAELLQKLAHSGIALNKIEFKLPDLAITASIYDKNKIHAILDHWQSEAKIQSYLLNTNLASVTAIGYGIKEDTQFIANVISTLAQHNIHVHSTDVDDISLSLLVNNADVEKTVKLIHEYIA